MTAPHVSLGRRAPLLHTLALILLLLATAVPQLAASATTGAGPAQPTMTAYHGSLHNHTGYSDGVETPDVAFTAGRDRGMDFMAVTDHSEMTADAEWLDTLAQAEAHTVDGVFVALCGSEYTNNAEGHLNVYNTTRHPTYSYTGFAYADHVGPLSHFYIWVGQHPEAVGQFNHPGWKNFNDWEYHGQAEAGMQLAEVGCCTPPNYVWNEAEYINALEHGWRVAPTISADTHTDQWGLDLPGRTGIWAPELTYASVIEALRAMRVFATEDGNLEIYLQVEGAWMGAVVPNDGLIDIQVYVYDPDDENVTNLALYTDGGQLITSIVPPSNPFSWSFPLAMGDGTRYYYARAIQADGDKSLTAPVWAESPITGLQAQNDGPTALGQPTTLMATLSGGSSVSYAWRLGDGTPGSGATLAHTYPAAGVYTAVVTASNHVSLLTGTTTIVVEDPIAGLSAVNDSPTALGQPTTLRATITGGTDVTYTWDVGATGQMVTHTYPAVGTHTAVVTASNHVSLLTATTTAVVEEPIAGLAAVNDSPTVLGQPTTLTATIAAGTHVTYTWELGSSSFPEPAGGDSPGAVGLIVTHTYPAVGVYSAVVTARNPVGSASATTRVVIEGPASWAVYLPLVVRGAALGP